MNNCVRSSLEFFKSKTVILAKAEAEREDRKHTRNYRQLGEVSLNTTFLIYIFFRLFLMFLAFYTELC